MMRRLVLLTFTAAVAYVPGRERRDVRQPGRSSSSERARHVGADRRGWRIHTTSAASSARARRRRGTWRRARRGRARWRPRSKPAESVPDAARVLQGRGDADAVERLRHQDRSVAAGRGDWNGKFQAVGNGGWAGTIALSRDGGGARRRLRDDEHRHGSCRQHGRVRARASGEGDRLRLSRRPRDDRAGQSIVNAYYSSAPKYSYFNGCSLGGRQGITEAQRYPADYDGIVAGAVAWGGMDRYVGVIMNESSHAEDRPAAYIPPEKYPAIHDAVLQACDGLDGVKDGVLENPLACQFDPKVLQCKAGEDSVSCLTAAQVQTAKHDLCAGEGPEDRARC